MTLDGLYWSGAALGALALLLWWWPRRPQHARVVAVIDGDTLEVMLANGRRELVRLAGIDAPDLCQPYGQEALHFLKRLVGYRWITVRLVGRDRYGRRLGFVANESADIAEALLRAGLAWPCESEHVNVLRAFRYRLAAHSALLGQRGLRRAGASKRKPWQAATRRIRFLGHWGRRR